MFTSTDIAKVKGGGVVVVLKLLVGETITADELRRRSVFLTQLLGYDLFDTVNTGDPETSKFAIREVPVVTSEALEYLRTESDAVSVAAYERFSGERVWFSGGSRITASADEQLLVIHTHLRAYNTGYSGGQWPLIKALLTWCQIKFSKATIHILDDQEVLHVVDSGYIEDTDKDYFNWGHDPDIQRRAFINRCYDADGNKLPVEQIVVPKCPFCVTTWLIPLRDGDFCSTCGKTYPKPS